MSSEMGLFMRRKTVGKVRPRRVQRAGGELRRCTSSLLSRMCHGVCRWPRSACRATSRPPTNAVTTNDNQRHVIATWFYLLLLLDIVRDMKNVLRIWASFPDL